MFATSAFQARSSFCWHEVAGSPTMVAVNAVESTWLTNEWRFEVKLLGRCCRTLERRVED